MTEEGVIFGAKRHLYGGMAPNNMKSFSAVYAASSAGAVGRLLMEFPENTVIEGQLITTVEGCAICRKEDTFPKNEFDGFLFNVERKDDICKVDDETVVPGKTYYYAAFPYSANGVYNRNPVNRASLDVIDSPPPSNMIAFTAMGEMNDGVPRIQITYTLPSDLLGSEGEPMGMIAGAVIRRSEENYPLTENDGDLVITVTERSGTFYDDDIEGYKIYYYTAFPYSTAGAYNRSGSAANRSHAEAKDVVKYPVLKFDVATTTQLAMYWRALGPKFESIPNSDFPKYDGVRCSIKVGDKDKAPSFTGIYFCKRFDRFAQSPDDVPSETYNAGIYGTCYYRMHIPKTYTGLIPQPKQDPITLEWIVEDINPAWGMENIPFIRENEIVNNEKIYVSIFVADDEDPNPSGISSSNTFLINSEDWVQPQPMYNQQLAIKPMLGSGAAAPIPCEYISYTCRMSSTVTLPSQTTGFDIDFDKYDFLVYYPSANQASNINSVVLTSFTEQNGLPPCNKGTMASNAVRMEDVTPTDSQYNLPEFIYAVSTAPLQIIFYTPSYSGRTAQASTRYWTPAEGSYMGMYVFMVDKTDTKRFVPTCMLENQMRMIYSAASVASLATQQSTEVISTQQLDLMEAMADMYETMMSLGGGSA